MVDEKLDLKELINDFKDAGVEKDDIIMLHSSLKSVGWVENGADTVIAALLSVLGEGGTLIVPTYTYSYSGREGVIAFNKKTTPSVNVGIIADTLWRRADAIRSDHPAYSFAAIGKYAEFLTDNHALDTSLGIGSPLHRLSEIGGKILLLGVGQDRNSLIHVAETIAGVKYQSIPFRESWGKCVLLKNEKGEEEYKELSQFPGCSYNFGAVENSLIENNIVRFGKVGNAVTRLMTARDVVDQVVKLLEKYPGILLCDRPECECCTNRKALLAKSL